MRSPVHPSVVALLAVAAFLPAACGSDDEDTTPAACLSGQKAYAEALQDAPGAVRLDGETPISDCLVRNQGAGDLARIGTILVGLTTDLNAEARDDPGGPPTVQLGYLVGAVTRGGEETQGIHAELIRRVEAGALFSPAGKPPPPPFDQTYRKGYAAGSNDG
jgi:hypothetical protein